MNIAYTKHKDSDIKGGLNINETNSGASTVMMEIFSQLAKKVIKGNFVDLLKISRPAKITSPLTHLICFANDYLYTELINKAAEQTDPIERLKYLTAFIISGLHTNPNICRSKAPFNPILGETYQCEKSDGTQMFVEQTAHHPPTSNFHMIGPEKSYELFGYGIVNSSITGANSVKGWREGKSQIKFKDGTSISFTTPDARVNGLVIGNRIYNYSGSIIITDHTHLMESEVTFPYKNEGKLQSLMTGIFSKKKETNLDEFSIKISNISPDTNAKELVTTGHGSWLGQVYFGSQLYWNINESVTQWYQNRTSLLLSDSSFRPDLNAILENNMELAQKCKEDLENLQRKDRELRKQ